MVFVLVVLAMANVGDPRKLPQASSSLPTNKKSSCMLRSFLVLRYQTMTANMEPCQPRDQSHDSSVLPEGGRVDDRGSPVFEAAEDVTEHVTDQSATAQQSNPRPLPVSPCHCSLRRHLVGLLMDIGACCKCQPGLWWRISAIPFCSRSVHQ